MNIALVLTQEYSPSEGGVQQSTYKLTKIFRSQGHNVIIISFYNAVDCSDGDVSIFYLGKYTKNILKVKIKELFTTYEINICINQSGYHIKITDLLKSTGLSNMKLINTLRINPLNFIQNAPLLIDTILQDYRIPFIKPNWILKPVLLYHKYKQKWGFKKILQRVDAFVLLSPSFFKELEYFGIYRGDFKNKIFAISNPFEFNEDIDIIKSRPKKNIILYVGRLNIVQKRVDLLMQIWEQLHSKLVNWEFWVVGDGPKMDFMKDYCCRYKMDKVRFFGFQDPSPFYQSAKILHFTSAYEGFGNVLVEAQREGVVPILFNSYSAAEDIIKDGRNGLLITPFNIEDFVSKTLNQIYNPKALKQLKLNAIQDSRNFSFEKISKKWESLFIAISNTEG